MSASPSPSPHPSRQNTPSRPRSSYDALSDVNDLTSAKDRILKLEAKLREQEMFSDRERQTLLAVIESYSSNQPSTSVDPTRVPGNQTSQQPSGANATPVSFDEQAYFQHQLATLQTDLQEAQQQHRQELATIKQKHQQKLDAISQELLGARERQRSAELDRDEALSRANVLNDELVTQTTHSDRESSELRQRIAQQQQELSGLRVALLAATDEASKPDLGLVQRVHELEDQLDEQRVQFIREKEKIQSDQRIEMAQKRGQLRRLQDEVRAAEQKVRLLQDELAKQNQYFQDESTYLNRQVEQLTAENGKLKADHRALTIQYQREKADHSRNTLRLQRELEHSVTLATEKARCEIRELRAELEALKMPSTV